MEHLGGITLSTFVIIMRQADRVRLGSEVGLYLRKKMVWRTCTPLWLSVHP